ncbi:MAG: alpha/beta fold hydrolase [Deltaproteobacteria bacterium]
MSRFVPTRALPFGHLMTIASALSEHVRRRPKLPELRRRFRTDDETEVLGVCSWHDDTPRATVIVLHGLTGDGDASYIVNTAHKLFARGFDVVRLNARNCGGTESWTPTLYHTGLTEDLAAVVDTLVAEGRGPLHAIGFSMGGNVVLKYAGERGAASHLERVVAVSPPVEIALASAAIDRGFLNGIYQRAFLDSLADLVRRKAKLFPGRYDVAGLKGATSLRIFDDRYIAPCFGFADADDYYFRASAGRHLEGIRAETLVLHARDDSFVPAAPLEEWRRWAPDHVHIEITERGGHVGFVARRAARVGDPDAFWAENRAVDWVSGQAGQLLGT